MLNIPSEGQPVEYLTDKDGKVSFEVSNTSDVHLQIYAAGYNDKSIVLSSEDIQVEEYDLDIQLTRGESFETIIVKSTVKNSANTRLKDVKVTYKNFDYYTNSNGVASIVVDRVNTTGYAELIFEKAGYVKQIIQIEDSEFEGKEVYEKTITLAEKSNTTIINAFIQGQEDTAIPRARVLNIPSEGQPTEYITNNEGKVSFEVDNTRDVHLQIYATGYEDKSIIISQADIAEVTVYDLNVTLTARVLPNTIILRNTVLDEEDNPLSQVSVVMEQQDVSHTVITNEQGIASQLMNRYFDVIVSISHKKYVPYRRIINKTDFVDKTVFENHIVLAKKTTTNINVFIKHDGKAINGANVHYKELVYTTGNDGEVLFTVPCTESFDMIITASGYHTLVKKVLVEDIEDVETFIVNIDLESSDYPVTYLCCSVDDDTNHNPVKDAIILDNGSEYITDSNGYVAFDVYNVDAVNLRVIHNDFEIRDITIPLEVISSVDVYNCLIGLTRLKELSTLIQLTLLGGDEEGEVTVPVPKAKVEYNNHIAYTNDKGLVEFEVLRDEDVDILINATGYHKTRKIISWKDLTGKRIYPLTITLEKILIVLMDVTVRSMDYKPVYGAMVGYKGLFYETDMRGKTEFHVVNTEDCILEVSCDGYKSRTYTITVDELRNKETYYLYVDLEAFQSYKSMTNDIKLVPNEYGEWDIQFSTHDLVNVGGAEALHNAIVILLLTRYGELKHNPLYGDDFGCKIHSLVKDNQNSLNKYKVEKYIEESLRKMRRISRINYIRVTDVNYGYDVQINVDGLNNENIVVKLELR